MTLSDFLLARIAEDEMAASTTLSATWNKWIERDCEAKRQIVKHHAPYAGGGGRPTLFYLAAIYADHPDYDEAWRP